MLGVLLGGRADTDVGPFRADMSVTPSLHGGTEVVIPPLGSLHLDSHDGPAHLQIRLGALDQGRTQALIDDPAGITRASQTRGRGRARGVVRLGCRPLAVVGPRRAAPGGAGVPRRPARRVVRRRSPW